MKEIAEYDSQFKYWNSRSKEENEIYPKYYETNIDLEIPGIQHGYLLIGSSYVGEILEDAIKLLTDWNTIEAKEYAKILWDLIDYNGNVRN